MIPLIVKTYIIQKNQLVLSEESGTVKDYGTTKEFSSKISEFTFYPWIPLSEESKIPCSADWVVTIVEPIKNVKTLYQERLKWKKRR